MPSNSGRKPCYQQRKRNNCEPDIVIDRTEQVTSESQLLPDEITASSISFSDPREQAEK